MEYVLTDAPPDAGGVEVNDMSDTDGSRAPYRWWVANGDAPECRHRSARLGSGTPLHPPPL